MISPAQDRLNVTLVAPCFHVWGKNWHYLRWWSHWWGGEHKKSVFSFFLVKYACLICVNCQTMLCVSLWWCVYTRLFFANHAWSNAEAKQQELLQVYRHLLFLRNGCISFLLSFIFEFFPACIRYCKRNIVHLFHVIELRAALAFKNPNKKHKK